MQTSGEKFRSQLTAADKLMSILLLIASVVIAICLCTLLGYYVKEMAVLIVGVLK